MPLVPYSRSPLGHSPQQAVRTRMVSLLFIPSFLLPGARFIVASNFAPYSIRAEVIQLLPF